jgi:hypothetical protein
VHCSIFIIVPKKCMDGRIDGWIDGEKDTDRQTDRERGK